MKGVRIVSGAIPGHPYGTQVFDENGTKIEGVRRIDLTVAVDAVNVARIEVLPRSFDLEAQAEIVPACRSCIDLLAALREADAGLAFATSVACGCVETFVCSPHKARAVVLDALAKAEDR